jgi:hypothetical protein
MVYDQFTQTGEYKDVPPTTGPGIALIILVIFLLPP